MDVMGGEAVLIDMPSARRTAVGDESLGTGEEPGDDRGMKADCTSGMITGGFGGLSRMIIGCLERSGLAFILRSTSRESALALTRSVT